jgi:two-component system sensor kinase FixL
VQIQQVVLNLVRNAIEAMEAVDRRELTITTRSIGDKIETSVADTGPGIAPELADRLFQPFVTTKKSGMGLGLSICREIVEAHHGHLTAAARPSGGTVFRLTLPKANQEDPADAG